MTLRKLWKNNLVLIKEDKYLGEGIRPEFKGDIKFKDVTFAYEENVVLKNRYMYMYN